MPATHSSLGLLIYAPVLTGNDGRTLAAVRGLERALPGVRMEWRVSEEGQPIALPQRDAWLAEAAALRDFPLLCNGDESYPVTIYGLETSASSAPGGEPLLDIHVQLPLDATVIAAAGDVLEGVAEGARALWGYAIPDRVAVDLAEQTRQPFVKPHTPPRGLPLLKPFWELRSPEIPPRLGWVNYWSAAAARAIGFPAPARDADLLARARRTASGGWIVPLTEAPLDLDNPAHMDALLRAYERFPEIGGRANP